MNASLFKNRFDLIQKELENDNDLVSYEDDHEEFNVEPEKNATISNIKYTIYILIPILSKQLGMKVACYCKNMR